MAEDVDSASQSQGITKKVSYREFEDGLHIYPSWAKRIVNSTKIFLAPDGANCVINPGQFKYVGSFNNLVFKFEPELGKPVILKVFPADEEGEERFKREVGGREFLHKTGIFSAETGVQVPNLLFADEANKVLFFDEVIGLKDDWEVKESLINNKSSSAEKMVVDFLVRLNEVQADESNLENFSYRSRYSVDSAYDLYQDVVRTTEKFKKWLKKNDSPAIQKWCQEKDLLGLMEDRSKEALSAIDPATLHKQIQPGEMRFNWGDVSLSNLGFIEKGRKLLLVPFDLEYCGWDHPSAGITTFLLHHQSEELPGRLKKHLLGEFIKYSRFDDQEKAELDAYLVMEEMHFVVRKLTAVAKPAHEVPGVYYSRMHDEPWSDVKIRVLLEPALERLKNGFLRAET